MFVYKYAPHSTCACWHSGLYASLLINMQHRNTLRATGIQHNRSPSQPCKRQRFERFIVIPLGLPVARHICGYRYVYGFHDHVNLRCRVLQYMHICMAHNECIPFRLIFICAMVVWAKHECTCLFMLHSLTYKPKINTHKVHS